MLRNVAAADLDRRIKVVLLNAHGGSEIDRISRRLSRPPLAGADVIMLCELDWGLKRSRQRPIAAELAQALGMSFAYSPEFALARRDREYRAFFGNAILAKAPLEDVRTVPLSPLFDWEIRQFRRETVPWPRRIGQRGAMVAKVRVNGASITLGVAHLENRTLPRGRARQLLEFLTAVGDGPAIIGGDLNTLTVDLSRLGSWLRMMMGMVKNPRRLRQPQAHEPLFDELERANFEYETANQPLAPTYTPMAGVPRLLRPKLDWLAARVLTPIRATARVIPASDGLGRRLSDHDFVVCEFEQAAQVRVASTAAS